MRENELKALITLLEDDDREVIRIMENNLLDKGETIVPILEKVWQESLNEEVQNRVETIIDKIQFNSTIKNLVGWAEGGGTDLLTGAWYIARYVYPKLEFAMLIQKIDSLAYDIEAEMPMFITPLEKIKVVNHVLYNVHKFTRNTTDYLSPDNSCINQVIKERRGNSVSLAIIYQEICRRLKLPVSGVNLPKNYILAYENPDNSGDIFFYINPFNQGVVLGKREIDFFVKQQKLKPDKSFYYPCSNVETIKRLLSSLADSYQESGKADKLQDIKRLIKALSRL